MLIWSHQVNSLSMPDISSECCILSSWISRWYISWLLRAGVRLAGEENMFEISSRPFSSTLCFARVMPVFLRDVSAFVSCQDQCAYLPATPTAEKSALRSWRVPARGAISSAILFQRFEKRNGGDRLSQCLGVGDLNYRQSNVCRLCPSHGSNSTRDKQSVLGPPWHVMTRLEARAGSRRA